VRGWVGEFRPPSRYVIGFCVRFDQRKKQVKGKKKAKCY